MTNMKSRLIMILTLSIALILTACGAKNETPMSAAKIFMQSVVEGDAELNAKVNHSDLFSFPPDHMMEMANDYDLVGKDLNEFTFEQDPDNERRIVVTWEREDGKELDWGLVFNKEKEGYFFTGMKSY
jgi:hypothetical protein